MLDEAVLRCRSHQRGFTLIEVVVAFAIFALAATALFEVFGGAMRRTDRARAALMVQLESESVMALARVSALENQLSATGKSLLGNSWQAQRRPVADAPAGGAWRAYEIVVQVGETAEGRLRSVGVFREPPP